MSNPSLPLRAVVLKVTVALIVKIAIIAAAVYYLWPAPKFPT
ncbi:hypothetical protein [Skermanella stibiiresistens]|nr:hypothetical protein [Skermanella stibiiresistens]